MIHLPIGVVASGKAKTAQVLGGGAGGARGGVDGEAGDGGHWTEARERHMALANVASNMPVASGKEWIRSKRGKLNIKRPFCHHGDVISQALPQGGSQDLDS